MGSLKLRDCSPLYTLLALLLLSACDDDQIPSHQSELKNAAEQGEADEPQPVEQYKSPFSLTKEISASIDATVETSAPSNIVQELTTEQGFRIDPLNLTSKIAQLKYGNIKLDISFIANIRSQEYGTCLALHDVSVEQSTPLHSSECQDEPGQKFSFFAVPNKIDTFLLRLADNDLCVVLSDASSEVDAAAAPSSLLASPCGIEDALNFAQFRLQRLDNNQYALIQDHLRWTDSQQTADEDSLPWQIVNVEGEIPAEASPAVAGNWSEVIDWPHIPVSVATLPDGRLLTWSAYSADNYRPMGQMSTLSSIYDPVSGRFTTTNNYAKHDMFCSGITLLQDGTVHASGGSPTRDDVSLFRPESGIWEESGSMHDSRWYGTTALLPDGDVFATHAKGAGNRSEVYSTASGEWRKTPGATMQTLQAEQTVINADEAHDNSVDGQWYAFMHVAPDGRVFHAGPTPTMHWFDTRYEGTVEEAGTLGDSERMHMFGSSVMYDNGKLLITGGNDRRKSPSSTNTAYTIDIASAPPVVEVSTPMHYSRVFHNSVVLPDGKVLVVGGNSSGVLFSDKGTELTPEVWNPETATWKTLADMTVPRNYHSVAVLMADGRVFSGGGGLCGSSCDTNHINAQIFSPPYLFNADGIVKSRPTILNAPDTAEPGETIRVRIAEEIDNFSLIRLSGTTHGINTDQRFMRPTMEHVGADVYELKLLENPNVLVAGNYWLFALDANGVPSTAHTINIREVSGENIPGSFRARLKSVESGKCFGLPGIADGPNDTLRQVTCKDLPEQSFDFTPVDGESNVFTLSFVHTGQCLDLIVEPDEWVKNGTDLVQRSCTNQVGNSSSQHFRIISHGLGQYLIASVPNGKVLDLRYRSHAEGAPIQLWEALYFDTQLWVLD